MLIENGSVGAVREKEANKELQTSEPSTPTLTLYDIENNGECKVVREALSILDLSCTIKPCPYGAVTHRKEIENLLGRKNVALPLLLDSRALKSNSQVPTLSFIIYFLSTQMVAQFRRI